MPHDRGGRRRHICKAQKQSLSQGSENREQWRHGCQLVILLVPLTYYKTIIYLHNFAKLFSARESRSP